MGRVCDYGDKRLHEPARVPSLVQGGLRRFANLGSKNAVSGHVSGTYKSAILTAIFLSNSRVDRASIDLHAVREWPSFCGSTTHRILGSRRCLERLHHEPELLDWTRHRSTKPEDRTPRSGCETLLTVVERSSIENNEGGLETLKCVDGTIK